MKIYNCTGRIVEIFPSIQGEGYKIGSAQLFIRFAGCNLKCKSCDTSFSWTDKPDFTLQTWSGETLIIKNPVRSSELADIITASYPLNAFHSVSFTGGEPLMQSDFLLEVAELLIRQNVGIFIETNGTIDESISKLEHVVSYWSVDLKLSRKWGLSAPSLDLHKAFLNKIPHGKTTVKLVFSIEDDRNEILHEIGKLDFSAFKLVIQPFWDECRCGNKWNLQSILESIKLFQPYFYSVRWIPQMHKLLRIP